MPFVLPPILARKMGEEDVISRIVTLLESNGTMDQTRYRQLVLLALADVIQTSRQCEIKLGAMEGKVRILENNSIMLLAKRHKKLGLTLLGIWIMVTVYSLVHFGLLSWAAELLNIPLP